MSIYNAKKPAPLPERALYPIRSSTLAWIVARTRPHHLPSFGRTAPRGIAPEGLPTDLVAGLNFPNRDVAYHPPKPSFILVAPLIGRPDRQQEEQALPALQEPELRLQR